MEFPIVKFYNEIPSHLTFSFRPLNVALSSSTKLIKFPVDTGQRTTVATLIGSGQMEKMNFSERK